MARVSSFISSGPPPYHEEQHFRQWWLWVLVVGIAALGWWSFVQQILLGRPFGDNPAPDWGAYNVSGNRGVDITLRDGRRVMLGSQRADELAETIGRQRSKAPRE